MSGLTQKGVPATQPRFLFFIKIAILVLSLIILALAAYSISLFSSFIGYYGSGAGGLLIFVAIKTFIVYGGVTAIEIYAPHLFYRILVLVAYIFSLIFWLSAWAWAASSAAAYLSLFDGVDDGYYNGFRNEGGALAGCAALGAIVWVLSIVHFGLFVRACLSDPEGSNQQNQAELGQVKPQPQAYAQQQPVYSQQPVYAQQPAYPAQ